MAKDKETVGSQMLGLVGRAKPEDLAEIDAMIAAKEKELDEVAADKEKEIKALRTMRKVLALALGLAPQRKKPERKPTAAPSVNGLASAKPNASIPKSPMPVEERRKAIAVRLFRNGDATTAELAREFNVSPPTIPNTLQDHPWFDKDENVYGLTPQGREAARQLSLNQK